MRIQLPASGPDPEGVLAFTQLSGALRLEVRRIPPLMRNVVLLRDIRGLPRQMWRINWELQSRPLSLDWLAREPNWNYE
jgi:hypothetical protein